MKALTRCVWFAASLALTAALIGVWAAISQAHIISPVFFPSPQRTWDALVEGVATGSLVNLTATSVVRMLIGWGCASIAGVVIGSLIGISPAARAYLGPTLEFIRPIPASAVMPVAIAVLGLTDRMVLAVIVFGAIWPVLLSTVHAFAAVQPRLYEVGQSLELSRRDVIVKLVLPSTVPDIIAGMRIGLTVSLILTVVGEMLASEHGLGFWILLAARNYHGADLYAGVAIFGAIGYLSSEIMSLVEARALRWRRV